MFELWLFGHPSLPRVKYVVPLACGLPMSFPCLPSVKDAKPEMIRDWTSLSSSSIPRVPPRTFGVRVSLLGSAPLTSRTGTNANAIQSVAKRLTKGDPLPTVLRRPAARRGILLPRSQRCKSGLPRRVAGTPPSGGGRPRREERNEWRGLPRYPCHAASRSHDERCARSRIRLCPRDRRLRRCDRRSAAHRGITP